jgi:tRNA(fMet)-specific endonuclease VapC
MKYLIDADIFSYMVRGDQPAINERMTRLLPGEASLSVITLGEFAYGTSHLPISKLRQQRAQRLIDFLGIQTLDETAALAYGKVRAALRKAGQPIGPNDMWLAAHALSLGVTLVTNNTREFDRVKGLKLENWAGGIST